LNLSWTRKQKKTIMLDDRLLIAVYLLICFISFSNSPRRFSTSSFDKPCSCTYKFRVLLRQASVQPRKYLCSFSSEHKICLLHSGSAQFTYRSHGLPSKWSTPTTTCSV